MAEGIYEAVYTGSKHHGLINGHKYRFAIENGKYTYNVDVMFDITKNKAFMLSMVYSSEISIRQNWSIE